MAGKQIGWKKAYLRRRFTESYWGMRSHYTDYCIPVVLKLEILGTVVKPIQKHWVGGLGREIAKYRTDKVRVLAMYDTKGKRLDQASAVSGHNIGFRYYVGKVKSEPALSTDPHYDCAAGIHYFKSRKAAEAY